MFWFIQLSVRIKLDINLQRENEMFNNKINILIDFLHKTQDVDDVSFTFCQVNLLCKNTQ